MPGVTGGPVAVAEKRKADVVVGREQQAHESLVNVSTPPLADESQRHTPACYGDNTQPDRIDSESVAFNRLSVSPQSRETTHTSQICYLTNVVFEYIGLIVFYVDKCGGTSVSREDYW